MGVDMYVCICVDGVCYTGVSRYIVGEYVSVYLHTQVPEQVWGGRLGPTLDSRSGRKP